MTAQLEVGEFLGFRFERGGRAAEGAVDCLGLTLLVLERLGLSAPDPWQQVHEAWRNGQLDAATGFGPGWRRIERDEIRLDGDVLLFTLRGVRAAHVAVLLRGYVLHATPEAGVHAQPWTAGHAEPEQAWRYQP